MAVAFGDPSSFTGSSDAAAGHERELSLVFGGGGAFGIAWHLAVIAALRDAGLDMSSAPAVGTSAGAWACAALRLDLDIEAFASVHEIKVPDFRRGILEGVAREVFGDREVADAHISAVAIPRLRHRIYRAEEHSVAQLVAASSAVPGVFAPQRIGRTLHIDGGVRSPDGVEFAPGAKLLVASIPLGGPLMGPLGRVLESSVRLSLRRWSRRHGGETVLLRPGRRLSALIGTRPSRLFDVGLAHEVYPLAYEQVSQFLAARRHTVPALVAA